jgi:hypothetical protein
MAMFALQATQTSNWMLKSQRMEEAMANDPITPAIRSDIATPESAAIGVAVNGQKLEPASRGSSGVLKELALSLRNFFRFVLDSASITVHEV